MECKALCRGQKNVAEETGLGTFLKKGLKIPIAIAAAYSVVCVRLSRSVVPPLIYDTSSR